MDTMTLVERMFGHLMWPAVVLAALVLFRKPIRDVIPRFKHFRAGPIEGWLSEALKDSHDAITESPDPPPDKEMIVDRAKLQKIAQVSPRAAVIEAFSQVDTALKAALAGLGQNALRSTQAVILAQRVGLLDHGSAEAWNILRAVSIAARHEEHFDVAREKVADYIDIATTLRAIIDSNEAVAQSRPTASEPKGDLV